MQTNHQLPYLCEVDREPPPYPTHLTPYCQPGYRQSYSGSEASTDVSFSSSENLSISGRMEPQGEENFQPSFYPVEVAGSKDLCHDHFRSQLAMQDRIEVKTVQQGTFYLTGKMERSLTNVNMQYENEATSKSQNSYLQCIYGATSGNFTCQKDNYQTPQMVTAHHHQRPPPQYPGTHHLQCPVNENSELHRSCEIIDKSGLMRSQPDLKQLSACSSQQYQFNPDNFKQNTSCSPSVLPRYSPNLPQKCTAIQELEQDQTAIVNQATQLVEMLSEENQSLHQELNNLHHKVSKLQKLEAEIQKIHNEHESLVKHTNKRTKLEAAMKVKLEQEILKLQEWNRNLKNQLQKSSQISNKNTNSSSIFDSHLVKDLENKEATITKLKDKNKELTTNQERLEIGSEAQKSTLREQRAHIEVLDKALTNAQSNVLRLEKQLCKKQEQIGKIEDLQKTLSSVQSATAKREMLEQKLRSKLEEEIWLLKMKLNQQQLLGNKAVDQDEGISSETDAPTSVQALLHQLHEREQCILQLQTQVLQWEQKYLQECALRQISIDAETRPQLARIAALEQNSLETEKIMDEARAERLGHLDEVYQVKRKCADLETSLNSMQAKLAEKDAVIKVLQKHSMLPHAGSFGSLLCPSSLHSRKMSDSSQMSAESGRDEGSLDICMLRSSMHDRSSSEGSSGVSSIDSKDLQSQEAQENCPIQNALLLDEEDDHITSCLWQV